MSPTLVAVLVSAAIALAGPVLARPLLERARIIDTPNARSSHTAPVLRGAGVVQLVAIATGLLVIGLGLPAEAAFVIIAIAACASLLGLVDDLRGLSARVRFGAQLILAVALGSALLATLGSPWWVAVVSAGVLVAYINMANFMDGINGISAIHGAVVGVAYAVVGFVGEVPWLQAAGGVIAVAFGGFLPWNFLGKRMFLGDCGSYLLGSIVAATAACAMASGVPAVVALAPLAVYAAETLNAIVKRMRRGERWWDAHREHWYQQMVDAGAKHLGVSFAVGLFTAVSAAAGMLAFLGGLGAQVVAGVGILAVCFAYFIFGRARVRSLEGRP